RSGSPTRSLLLAPVQVGVGDHLVGWRRPPLGQGLGRMGVADQGRVITPGEGAMKSRADAHVGLGADDHEAPNSEAGQNSLEVGVLEGVAVALVHVRLGVVR